MAPAATRCGTGSASSRGSEVELEPREAVAPGFRARVATADDLGAIHAVERLAQPAPWSEEVFRKELELDWSHAWIVEPRQAGDEAGDGPGGEPAGLPAVCAFLVFWVVHDEIHILNVAVHPDARRRGLARALVDDLIAQAEARAITALTLEVRAGTDAAQGLYAAAGFRVIAVRPSYYADNGEDALVMARVLNG